MKFYLAAFCSLLIFVESPFNVALTGAQFAPWIQTQANQVADWPCQFHYCGCTPESCRTYCCCLKPKPAPTCCTETIESSETLDSASPKQKTDFLSSLACQGISKDSEKIISLKIRIFTQASKVFVNTQNLETQSVSYRLPSLSREIYSEIFHPPKVV